MDHKAAGYHLARSQGAVCGKVGAWRAGREAEQLPDSPPRLDFYLRDNFGMAKVEWLAGTRLGRTLGHTQILVRFITSPEVLYYQRCKDHHYIINVLHYTRMSMHSEV